MYGAHLKASAAMVRLRLYDVLALLPTQSFESKSAWILKYLLMTVEWQFNILSYKDTNGSCI